MQTITSIPTSIATVEQAKAFLGQLWLNNESHLFDINTDLLGDIPDQLRQLPDFSYLDYLKSLDEKGAAGEISVAIAMGIDPPTDPAPPAELPIPDPDVIPGIVSAYQTALHDATQLADVSNPFTAEQDQLAIAVTMHRNYANTYLRLFNDVKKDFELISKDPFTVMHFQPQRPEEYQIFRDMLQRFCEYHRYKEELAQTALNQIVSGQNKAQ